MFSRLVIVVLLAVTLGLYLQIVLFDAGQTPVEPAPQASIQVVEDQTTTKPAAGGAQALPDDQMLLIKQVFAPEMLAN